jgi:hypothetical protein
MKLVKCQDLQPACLVREPLLRAAAHKLGYLPLSHTAQSGMR